MFTRERAIFLVGLLAALLIFSCNKNPQEVSKEDVFYKTLYEDASKIYHHNNHVRQQQYIDSVYATLTSVSPYGSLRRLIDKAAYYDGEGEPLLCLLYADSALTYLPNEDTRKLRPQEYLTTLLFRGNTLSALRRYREAYDCFFLAKTFAEHVQVEHCVVSDFSYSLAMILYRQKRFKESVGYFRESYEEAMKDCGTAGFRKIQERIANVALCYTRLGQADSALYYYGQALSYIDQNIRPAGAAEAEYAERSIAVIYGNLAPLLAGQGLRDSAKKLLKKSIEVGDRLGFERQDAEITKAKLADLYISEHQDDSAMVILQSLSKELDTLPNTEARLMLNKAFNEIYDRRGMLAEAYAYHTKYFALKDSIDNTNRVLLQGDIDQQLNDRQRNYELDLLQKNNKANRQLLWISIAFSILVLVVIIQVYLSYRRSRNNVLLLKKLNDEVARTNAKLEQSNHDKDRILHVVAHDLRSPVGSMGAIAERLLTENEPTPKLQDELVNLIQQASGQSMALINELLNDNYSGAAAAGDNKPVSVQELIIGSVALAKFKADEKNQQLDVQLPDQPVQMLAQFDKMKRVVDNLLTNAIKFSHNGGVITVAAHTEQGRVLVSVQDHGIGIPASAQGSVFDKFGVARRPGTAGERSIGLGLSVSREIIEAHGGMLWLESKEHEGTSVFFSLPLYNGS